MTASARRDALRLRAATLRDKANARCQQVEGAPDFQQRLRGFMHLSDSVQRLLLLDAAISGRDLDDLLDLAETILLGVEEDLDAFERRVDSRRTDSSGAKPVDGT